VVLHNDAPLHVVPMSGGSEVPISSWPPSVAYQAEPDPCVPLLPALPKGVCVTGLSFQLSGVQPPDPVGGIAEIPDISGRSLAEGDPARGGGSVSPAAATGGSVAAILLVATSTYALRRMRGRPAGSRTTMPPP
jgi:hypothetical protein